jgi:tRNA pseudouridine55 synthase
MVADGASGEGADGLVIVDKPADWTSHDVVARCRTVFRLRRVGHAGTLDPGATGVLVVGLGRATRLLRFLVGLPKSYTAEVVLGVATSTQDAGGEVVGRWDMRDVTLARVREAAAGLTGTIQQVPPMVSAVKVGGRRLHQLAREGIDVPRQARTVTVSRFDVRPAGPSAPPGADGPAGEASGPVVAVDVDCSSGTYVRTLAADLGVALGGGAHLRNLRRTAVGRWTVENAVALERVADAPVLPPEAAVDGLARVVVTADQARGVGHGKVLAASELGARGSGPWAVLGPGGTLLAVYQAHGEGRVKPVLVLGAGPGASGTRRGGGSGSFPPAGR